MKTLFVLLFILLWQNCLAQQTDTAAKQPWQTFYRATAPKLNDLVHTKLDARFDYQKSRLYGKALLTLHPHFYPTDQLVLNAKGMTFTEISRVANGKTISLSYTYDTLQLTIKLDKGFRSTENYTLYLNYTAAPNEFKKKDSILPFGDKGLYFINPTGALKNKPVQIWTQGATEANSCWVPTIDKPNQKTTTEISMTVPAKYVTLSNGLLTDQKINADGTRTDTWKSDLPFAPYLMFMGVGDYAIIKDKYKNKEVSYYVEKEYAPIAKRIFGNTPEMMAYFSKITGVDYPWQKYAQMVGRDYIFGAMENVSATLHEESAQQDAKQLVDGNSWEEVIAHELFHQWFGDYVTTESWSNITVNESFADYGETLWNEYKYGKEVGEAKIYADLRTYLSNPDNAANDLVRFHYENVMDAFDNVGYQKGGCILHMLRHYVGDSAFFKSINLYLTTYKFKTAEAQNLRLAFEEVTGQDLNWFFNQWYYASGHPKLNISYRYDSIGNTAKVYIRQSQAGKAFTFPVAIDVYEGAGKNRYSFFVQHAADTFSIPYRSLPLLINVDADKTLVCEKTDAKTAKNFMFQYGHGGNYVDRRESIAYFLKNQTAPGTLPFLTTALKDKNEGLRIFVLGRLEMAKDSIRKAMEPILISLAQNDPKPLVRAAAIRSLDTCKNAAFASFLKKAVFDSSYSIAADALTAMAKIDSVGALNIAKQLSAQPARGTLPFALATVLSKYGNSNDYPLIYHHFTTASINEKLGLLTPMAAVLAKMKDTTIVKKETDNIVDFRNNLPGAFSSLIPFLNTTLNTIATAQKTAGATAVAAYIQSKFPVIVVPAEIAISPDSLKKYTGQFTTSGNNATLTISLKDGGLLMMFPGQPDYPLAYAGSNKFTLKTMAGYAIQFKTNASGEVAGLSLLNPDGTTASEATKTK